ncbi:DUF397 domain-containing protein [Nonomuraea wenchangensis]
MERPPARDHAIWRRYCNGGSCVEVAMLDGRVWVRGSQDASGAVLPFSVDEWSDFIRGVKDGHFDLERLAPGA